MLADATPEMALAHEETFGPLAPLFRFHKDEEAVAMANAVSTDLAAYIFTESLKRSVCVSEAIEASMVGINTGAISTEIAPFGGIKESGYGREGSKYGIEEYLDVKYLALGCVNS